MEGCNDEEQKAFVKALKESELIDDLQWESPIEMSWLKHKLWFMIGYTD